MVIHSRSFCLPGGVDECFEFGWHAFDVAEQLQTPVFVLSDLDMGMNQWMSKPFEYPNIPMERGKVLWEKDLEELKGNWGRYLDKDGDGIPYRTVPGNRHPMSSYFTRGTGHDENARYTEDSSMWLKNMDRLKKKYETARKYVPAPVLYDKPGATVGIIGFGSTEAAILEAVHQLETEHGIKADFLRVRALPFTQEVTDFVNKYDQIFVVEMNRDGQLNQILTVEYPERAAELQVGGLWRWHACLCKVGTRRYPCENMPDAVNGGNSASKAGSTAGSPNWRKKRRSRRSIYL